MLVSAKIPLDVPTAEEAMPSWKPGDRPPFDPTTLCPPPRLYTSYELLWLDAKKRRERTILYRIMTGAKRLWSILRFR